MHEFHRVLDRDDVAGGRAVAVIDHRGQRGRLAGAGGTHHQHQAALVHHHVLQHLRQLELLEVRDLGRDGADHHAHALLLHVHVDPKARQPRHGDREIAFHLALEFLALAGVHQRVSELAADVGAELLLGERLHLAVGLHAGREIRRDEQVRAPGLHHRREQSVHVAAGLVFGECGHGRGVPIKRARRGRARGSRAIVSSHRRGAAPPRTAPGAIVHRSGEFGAPRTRSTVPRGRAPFASGSPRHPSRSICIGI